MRTGIAPVLPVMAPDTGNAGVNAIRPSICFLAHNAHEALAGERQRHAGGIERQQATMATWLARNGWDVSMITWDDGSPTPEKLHGVRLVPLCRRDDGIPGLRFFVPRWTSLLQALRQASADLYYYNCGDLGLGQLMLWAGKRRNSVIFSVPSDPDCDARLPSLKSPRERLLYRYGLRQCDNVIVQTRKQRDMLVENFSKNSTILSMPCTGFEREKDVTARSPGDPLRVLWIGRWSTEKRLEWVLEIAEQLPDVRFTVVGAPNTASAYADDLEQRAARISNVQVAGRVDYKDMGQYFHAADVLCCTSVYEGFPNVFLEAWSAGVPVVTTCDPDGLIQENRLGRQSDSLEGLREAIREYSESVGVLQEDGSRAISYFSEHHELDTAMRSFSEYFRDVMARAEQTGRAR